MYQIHDQFALRDGETIAIVRRNDKHVMLVRAVPVEPPGDMHEIVTSTIGAGNAIEHSAIIASKFLHGKWSWMWLAQDTKSVICDVLFRTNHNNEWMGLEVEDAR